MGVFVPSINFIIWWKSERAEECIDIFAQVLHFKLMSGSAESRKLKASSGSLFLNIFKVYCQYSYILIFPALVCSIKALSSMLFGRENTCWAYKAVVFCTERMVD